MHGVTMDVVLDAEAVERIRQGLLLLRKEAVTVAASAPRGLASVRRAAEHERDLIDHDLEAIHCAVAVTARVPETPRGEG